MSCKVVAGEYALYDILWYNQQSYTHFCMCLETGLTEVLVTSTKQTNFTFWYPLHPNQANPTWPTSRISLWGLHSSHHYLLPGLLGLPPNRCPCFPFCNSCSTWPVWPFIFPQLWLFVVFTMDYKCLTVIWYPYNICDLNSHHHPPRSLGSSHPGFSNRISSLGFWTFTLFFFFWLGIFFSYRMHLDNLN